MEDNGDTLKTFRPALRSLWFLFFGLALGPAVPLFGRAPQGEGVLGWAALSLVCLGVILHRLGLKYTLSAQKIQAQAWWGRGPVETVTLARLGGVRVNQGWGARLVGVAHLEVRSLDPGEPGLILLGQPAGRELAGRLEALAAKAASAEAASAEAGKTDHARG